MTIVLFPLGKHCLFHITAHSKKYLLLPIMLWTAICNLWPFRSARIKVSEHLLTFQWIDVLTKIYNRFLLFILFLFKRFLQSLCLYPNSQSESIIGPTSNQVWEPLHTAQLHWKSRHKHKPFLLRWGSWLMLSEWCSCKIYFQLRCMRHSYLVFLNLT